MFQSAKEFEIVTKILLLKKNSSFTQRIKKQLLLIEF